MSNPMLKSASAPATLSHPSQPTVVSALAACADPDQQLHHVEHDVRRHLLAEPDLKFSSLVVRRIQNGVCLQGILEVGELSPDIDSLARQVVGVREVINQLLVKTTTTNPAAKPR